MTRKEINVNALPAEVLKTMMQMEDYINKTAVSLAHKHLIKIRASEMNGCSFCLDMHKREAKKSGESEERINEVANWKTSHQFLVDEKLVLELTEVITLSHQNPDALKTFQNALKIFSKEYLVEVTMIIITINSWNRLVTSYDLLMDAFQQQSSETAELKDKYCHLQLSFTRPH